MKMTKMKYLVVTICAFTSIALAKCELFQCVGTCYSGRLIPLPENIVYGKHLNGYSYRNITTDDAKKCISSCVNDCRCKACQMKDASCELLDEDETTRADDFVAESGYVYYDLKQELYKGKSHMVQPGVCYNGCCRSQPCMNGGTCVEHCDTPKNKFSCKCRSFYVGKVCDSFVLTSCLDVLKTVKDGQIPTDGVYNVVRIPGKTNTFPYYCAFNLNQAWTLIQSFSLSNKDTFADKPFYSKKFLTNNYSPPNWHKYRIGLFGIKIIRAKATLFRATCDFPKRMGGALTPDFLLGNLSDVDITSPDEKYWRCKKYMQVNILGHECFDCTAATFGSKSQHIHIDVTASWIGNCEFKPSIRHNADNFGLYASYDNDSMCVQTPESTTQWWLGEEK